MAKHKIYQLLNQMTYAVKYDKSDLHPVLTAVVKEKRPLYQTEADFSEIQEPIDQASDIVRQIIERVLQAEKDKIYMKQPRSINDDILKIIKDLVQ